MNCRIAKRSEDMWTELSFVYRKSVIAAQGMIPTATSQMSRGKSMIYTHTSNDVENFIPMGKNILDLDSIQEDPLSWEDHNFCFKKQELNMYPLADVMKLKKH